MGPTRNDEKDPASPPPIVPWSGDRTSKTKDLSNPTQASIARTGLEPRHFPQQGLGSIRRMTRQGLANATACALLKMLTCV